MLRLAITWTLPDSSPSSMFTWTSSSGSTTSGTGAAAPLNVGMSPQVSERRLIIAVLPRFSGPNRDTKARTICLFRSPRSTQSRRKLSSASVHPFCLAIKLLDHVSYFRGFLGYGIVFIFPPFVFFLGIMLPFFNVRLLPRMLGV